MEIVKDKPYFLFYYIYIRRIFQECFNCESTYFRMSFANLDELLPDHTFSQNFTSIIRKFISLISHYNIITLLF